MLAILFLSGFSTSEKVTELSGRGVGLSIAYSNIVERLNGSIDVATKKNVGTRFTIKFSINFLIMDALIVEVANNSFTVPLSNIKRIYNVNLKKIFYHHNEPYVVIKGNMVPVVSIRENFQLSPSTSDEIEESKKGLLIIWERGQKTVGILVDKIRGQQQIVYKRMDRLMSKIKGFNGFTFVGKGEVVPIIDPLQFRGY